MRLSEVRLGFENATVKLEPPNKLHSDPGDVTDYKDIDVDSKDAVGEFQLQKVPGNTSVILKKLPNICCSTCCTGTPKLSFYHLSFN